MTGPYAVAQIMGGDTLILDVRGPGGTGFSDQLALPAGVDWREVAAERLARAGYRVGEWWHKLDDEEWRADVEPAER